MYVGNMLVSSKQSKLIILMKNEFKEFIDSHLMKVVIDVIDDPVNGCFSSKHCKFHRLDRFHKLCNKIRDIIHSQLSNCVSETKNKVNGKSIYCIYYCIYSLNTLATF